jgi:hypothetical protein
MKIFYNLFDLRAKQIKKVCLTIVFIFCLFNASGRAALSAQSVDLFGYFEPQIMAASFDGAFVKMSSNKLRVDLQMQPSTSVLFGANFDFITYHGCTKWNIIDFLPEQVKDEIPDWQQMGIPLNPYQLPYNNRQFLDNAFVKLTFKYADVTVGKQQLSMGSGYAWNPTDLFNRKDITDPTYEQEGHNAVRVDMPAGPFNLTAMYAPTETWEHTDLLFKAKTFAAGFDFTVVAIQKNWNYSDARIFDLADMNYYKINTRRHMIGGDIVGELFGLGVWTEGTYNDMFVPSDEWAAYQNALLQLTALSTNHQPLKIKDSFFEMLAGMDYTFDFQTYVMAEYYHNSYGRSHAADYTFNDWMQYILAERRTIICDQMFLYARHPLTDLIDVSSSILLGLSDRSWAFIPSIVYNLFQNIDLILIGNIYMGDEGSLFARNLGNGGLLRLRAYF